MTSCTIAEYVYHRFAPTVSAAGFSGFDGVNAIFFIQAHASSC
jgi:hypothetical protein